MNVGRPTIHRSAARRIDRIARRVHAFHRFAHHPLCEEYASEVLRAGERVVCRGCLAAILGAVAGVAAGWVLAPEVPVSLALLGLGAAGLAARSGKLLRRALPGLALNVPFGAALARPTLDRLLVAALALGVATVVYLRYRRRGPDRSPCATCPERLLAPCRGFAAAFRAETVLRRAAARAMEAPPSPSLGDYGVRSIRGGGAAATSARMRSGSSVST